MTAETPQLAAALAELQTQLPRIAKSETATVPTKTGGSYKYTYAGLAQVSDELLPLMGKLGLSFSAKPTLNANREFVLAYTLRHISGESDSGEWPLTKSTPQDMGGQITYARRYCLLAVTGCAPDDDDDDAAKATAAATKRASRPKAETVADGPTPANGEQMAKMGALFTQLGIADQPEKVRLAREFIGGRAIKSATDLTMVEADKVIARLTSWAAQETPPADIPGGAE